MTTSQFGSLRTKPAYSGLAVAWFALLCAIAFAASGCGSDSIEDQESTQETEEVADESQEVEESAAPDGDALAACALFANGGEQSIMQRIPSSLIGIGAEITSAQIDELIYLNSGLNQAAEQAPPDLADALTTLNEPFQQAADALDSGSGNLTMDTSHVPEDVILVMELCVDAGFQVDSAG